MCCCCSEKKKVSLHSHVSVSARAFNSADAYALALSIELARFHLTFTVFPHYYNSIPRLTGHHGSDGGNHRAKLSCYI